MVSDTLKELADRFAEFEHSGLQMAPEAVLAHRLTLRALALEVRHLEQERAHFGPMPPPLFAMAGGNIVPFRRPS
ncbi:MAG TPA: hypothetical protein VNX29_04355 [Kaistia sp.]|nr:hypothetical protein [Kaistia sp.]